MDFVERIEVMKDGVKTLVNITVDDDNTITGLHESVATRVTIENLLEVLGIEIQYEQYTDGTHEGVVTTTTIYHLD